MKQQFNVYLSPEMVAKAKHRAIDDQLSLSDLTCQALELYMNMTHTETMESLTLQPIVHVKDMAASIEFYKALGAETVFASRDGDWTQMKLGGSEIGLLAHPANPEQGEGEVELCFEHSAPLRNLESKLRAHGVTIVRGAADEAFGEQLQIAAPGGLLIKINRIDHRPMA